MKKLSISIYLFLSLLIAGLLGYHNRIISYTVLAWETTQSAKSVCSTRDTVNIQASFTNNESRKAMSVKVEDQQTAAFIDLGKIEAGQTKTGEIET